MSASGYKTIALAGAGHLGSELAKELLKGGYQVTLLSRGGSSNPHVAELKGLGAKVATVDYGSVDSLAEALQGTDVVITTLSGEALIKDPQYAIADAAKKVGVKLFIPTEWGLNLTLVPKDQLHPFIAGKPLVMEYLAKLGIPSLRIVNGLFGTYLRHFLGDEAASKKATVYDGPTLVVTHPTDIARFLRLAFDKLPSSRLENGTLTVAGFTGTWHDVAAKLPDWHFEYKNVIELEEISKQPSLEGFYAWLQLFLYRHRAQSKDNDNDLVGFQPQFDIRDYIP